MAKAQYKCPDCGDTCGFYTVIKTTDHQIYNWEGEGVDSIAISTKEGKKQKCVNCGKTVKISLKIS